MIYRIPLVVLLLTSSVIPKFNKDSHSTNSFDDTDLNDIFETSEILHPKAPKRRLEGTVVNILQDNLTSGPLANSVLKNDEVLPTNLFEVEDVPNDPHIHDSSETEGYRQVLNAMRIEGLAPASNPSPVETTSNSRLVEAKGGLNKALLKVLSVTTQLSDSAKPALTSDGVTINDLTEYYSSVLFGRKYIGGSGDNVQSEALREADGLSHFRPLVQQATVSAQEAESEEPVISQEDLQSAAVVVPNAAASVVQDSQVVTQAELENALVQNGAGIPSESAESPAVSFSTENPAQVVSQAELDQALAQNGAELSQEIAESEDNHEVESPSEEDQQISARLLSLVHLYNEHVQLQNRDIVADPSHYGHIRHLSVRLGCLLDQECDYSSHLKALQAEHNTDRHLLTQYMEQHKAFVPVAGNALHESHKQYLAALESLVSNEDIKRSTNDWINNSKQALSDFETNQWPSRNQNIQTELGNLRDAYLPLGKDLTPDQLLSVLNEASKKYKLQIDQTFTQKGLDDEVKELVNEKNAVESLYKALKSVAPAHGVLHADFDRLIQSLNGEIKAFQNAKLATSEQIENAKIRVKNEFQRQINGVDAVKNAELIRKISNNVDAILKSDFGKSLNKDNLDFIVHKSIAAAQTDLDQLRNNKKTTNFILDKSDLDKVTKDVLDELKANREPGQAVVLNLVDLHRQIQELNKYHSADVSSGDEANNAAEVLITHENYLYQRLGSDEFYDQLNDYVRRYYSVWIEHLHPLDDFVDYSALFKTMTNGLDNPNALGSANRVAARALLKTTSKQMRLLSRLSEEDKSFFNMVNHLMTEWAATTEPAKFVRKLELIKSALMGADVPMLEPVRIPEKHLVFALFEQVSGSVNTLIADFGQGVQSSIGLANTIGEGQALAQNVANQYQVGDLLTDNPTQPTGFWGKLKSKVWGWFGKRSLNVHYGLTDTIDSVKNLYANIVEAKKTAEQLKDTFQTGKSIADGASDLVKTLSG